MKQITEDYVSFETAKLLKEKGFDEPCWNYYYDSKLEHYFRPVKNNEWPLNRVSAPTHQMVLKWLREVHAIFISIMCCTYPTLNKVIWIPDITTFESVFPNSAVECDTYEEAVETAILYVLKNLI